MKDLLEKLYKATPDIKELGSGAVQWDNRTFNLKVTSEDLEVLINRLNSDNKEIKKTCYSTFRDYCSLFLLSVSLP